jgi:hypothetical protein
MYNNGEREEGIPNIKRLFYGVLVKVLVMYSPSPYLYYEHAKPRKNGGGIVRQNLRIAPTDLCYGFAGGFSMQVKQLRQSGLAKIPKRRQGKGEDFLSDFFKKIRPSLDGAT